MLFDQEEAAPAEAQGQQPPLPWRRRRFGRWIVALGVVVAVALVIAAAGALYVKGKIDPSGPPGEEVAVDIPLGTATAAIADILANHEVISDAEIFRWYVRFKGAGPFDAGQYRLQENMSMGDVISVLDEGPALPPAENLTVREGLWVEEVAAAVDEVEHLDGARFLELARSGEHLSKYSPPGNTSLEGLLFPDTYRIETREDELAVLRRMIDTMDAIADELGYADAEARGGVSPYEAIIVASLIEAEAKVDEDRGKIARVIYNRLEQGIPLGIDATFYFHLQRRGGSLRQSELDEASEYNTRQNQGLVPTPVAMPGRASLEAALNPEAGPWLYYVLQDASGVHFFTDDYNEFLRAKDDAERNGLIP